MVLAAVLIPLLAGPGRSEDSQEPRNPGEVPLKAVEIVQRARGVFVYRYAENMADIDPLKDFESARRIVDSKIIHELKQQLAENAEYSPQFTARCLPSWDYGLEFRESREKRRTILFSFRCKQMMIYEEKVYRDFTPQSVKFYALFNYELDEGTTRPLVPEPEPAP